MSEKKDTIIREIIDVSKIVVSDEILERTKIPNPNLLTHPMPNLSYYDFLKHKDNV